MSHLGSFGAAVKEIDPNADKDTFDFFAEKFIVQDVIPPVLMLQLGAAATGKIDDQEGLGAIWEAMRCCLTRPKREQPNESTGEVERHPEDASQFQRWYKLAVTEKCDLPELIRLAMALFEVQSGRPTEEPRGSSAGPSTTSPSSSTSSSTHPALQGMTPVAQVLGG